MAPAAGRTIAKEFIVVSALAASAQCRGRKLGSNPPDPYGGSVRCDLVLVNGWIAASVEATRSSNKNPSFGFPRRADA